MKNLNEQLTWNNGYFAGKIQLWLDDDIDIETLMNSILAELNYKEIMTDIVKSNAFDWLFNNDINTVSEFHKAEEFLNYLDDLPNG